MAKEQFLSAFSTFEKEAARRNPPWVLPLQRRAMARLDELGFPTLKDEEWKYTSVEPIVKNSYRFHFELYQDGLTPQKIQPFLFGQNWSRLVFINGLYTPELSFLSKKAEGVRIESLREALSSHPELLKSRLAHYADDKSNAFTALNTAFIYDGALIWLPQGKVLEEPIQLLFISVSEGETGISQPRNLIVASEGSQATIVESYFSISGGTYFTNAVTEVFLDRAAALNHYKIQCESEAAFHVATTQVSGQEQASFSSWVFSFGARLSRENLNVILEAEGANASLNGLYFVSGIQHVDHHTVIDHKKPRGLSRQIYKGILDGQSKAIFNGKIFVRPGAQKTDAHQTNKNLLLSQRATADTKPQLEIFADDVKCTHGAAVGQLEKEALFYVKSRGLGEESARSLLTYGFANEVTETVRIDSLREELNQWVLKRLA